MKKILLVLCTIACVLSMSACSKEEEEITPVVEHSSIDQSVANILSTLAEASDAELEEWANSRDSLSRTLAEAWMTAEEEAGEYVSAPTEYTYVDYEDYTSATGIMQFAERTATLTVEVGYADDEATNISYLAFRINPDYTKGELMIQAAQNTLMGMGSVFIILVILVFVISALGKVPALLDTLANKNKKNEKQEEIAVPAPVAAPVLEEEELVDDLELVAVITAAIAASENTSTDGLVVRSIKRAGTSKWKKA
ncbi:MAG: OadG family protein [Lachnospiraceae bacterium]